MKYLLDTCFIFELTKPEPNRGVTEWLQTANTEDLYLSVISIGEIKKEIHKLPISKKKQMLLLWAETLLADYQDRILGRMKLRLFALPRHGFTQNFFLLRQSFGKS